MPVFGERIVVQNRIAQEIVENERKKHPEFVFTCRGRPVGRRLNTAWKRVRVRAGLAGLRAQDLRHTFARRLRAVGVPLEGRKGAARPYGGRCDTP